MCLALDPEGAEDWLGQGDEDDLASELYTEEDLYPAIAEAPEVGIPELAPDLSREQLVQLQGLLKEYSVVIQAKPGGPPSSSMRSMLKMRPLFVRGRTGYHILNGRL